MDLGTLLLTGLLATLPLSIYYAAKDFYKTYLEVLRKAGFKINDISNRNPFIINATAYDFVIQVTPIRISLFPNKEHPMPKMTITHALGTHSHGQYIQFLNEFLSMGCVLQSSDEKDVLRLTPNITDKLSTFSFYRIDANQLYFRNFAIGSAHIANATLIARGIREANLAKNAQTIMQAPNVNKKRRLSAAALLRKLDIEGTDQKEIAQNLLRAYDATDVIWAYKHLKEEMPEGLMERLKNGDHQTAGMIDFLKDNASRSVEVGSAFLELWEHATSRRSFDETAIVSLINALEAHPKIDHLTHFTKSALQITQAKAQERLIQIFHDAQCQEAIPALKTWSESEIRPIQIAAIRALADCGDASCIKALTSIAEKRLSIRVASEAKQALQKIKEGMEGQGKEAGWLTVSESEPLNGALSECDYKGQLSERP